MLNIAVIGLGVVGGSIAKGLHEIGHPVVGWDHNDAQLIAAEKYGLRVASTLMNAVNGADIVFLATPVSTIAELAQRIAPHLRIDAVIADVGSTKSDTVAGMIAARDKTGRSDVSIIGTHPMAGKAVTGFTNAEADLFVGATWVLAPEPIRSDEHQARLEGWEGVLRGILTILGAGSTPVLAPEVHDQAVAACSHLVQATATSLAATVADSAARNDSVLQLAAGGFRDTTRVADSAASMWLPIMLANRTNIVPELDALLETLTELRDAVRDSDADAITGLFARGNAARDAWRSAQTN